MYTECPACKTEFRIHREQLETASGKVRCGECLAVFDARARLRTEPGEAALAPSTRGTPAASPPPHPPKMRTVPPRPPGPTATSKGAPEAARHASRAKPREAVEPLSFFRDEPAIARGQSGWWMVNLSLLGLLLGQYLWFNRDALAGIPTLRPAILALCERLPCDGADQPDPAAFELTGRSVQSHPAFQDALLIDATFVNNAATARPYPGLELVFADTEGRPLASRRFLPQEYLGAAPQQMLAPRVEVHVVLELLDPGDLAVGYEFRFF